MLAPFGVDSHAQKRQKDNHYGANQHIAQIHTLPLVLNLGRQPNAKNKEKHCGPDARYHRHKWLNFSP
jgi:hypothetical protein